MRIKRASPATVRLIPRGLEVRPEHLHKWNAYALMNRLHSQLKRSRDILLGDGKIGSMTCLDWLAGGVHGEFDPTAGLFQFHYHAIAAGQMISVVDALREQRPYERQIGDRVRARVWMSRQPLYDHPAPLGYPWQLFWPARARGDGFDDLIGTKQLHRGKRRIPEPHHTQMLLWLDRQRIEDMTLLMGLRVSRHGFVKTYVNGEGGL